MTERESQKKEKQTANQLNKSVLSKPNTPYFLAPYEIDRWLVENSPLVKQIAEDVAKTRKTKHGD